MLRALRYLAAGLRRDAAGASRVETEAVADAARTAAQVRAVGLARRRRTSRGYSLVEVMIVLTASALLASGPMLLLYNKVQEDNYTSVARQLEIVKSRVVEYAATRHTVSRVLRTNRNNPTVSRDGLNHFVTPDGRPHLPCPDVNGDGIEDRRNQLRSPGAMHPDAFSTNLAAEACLAPIGYLPHETLGVKPRDPWGNLLIYSVDQAAANLQIGFDAASRPSSFNTIFHLRWNGGRLSYERRNARSISHALPPLLCIGYPDDATDNSCAASPTGAGAGELQGEVVTSAVTVEVSDDYVDGLLLDFSPGSHENSLAEGLAFVVISPGRTHLGQLHYDARSRRSGPFPRLIACGVTGPSGDFGDV